MNREEDVFKLYDEIDELLESIDLNKEENIDIPTMPSILFDDNSNIINEELFVNTDVKEEINEEVIQEEKNKKEIKEKKKKIKKNKNKTKKWVVLFSIFDVIAITCIFLMYGPISYFRNLWVTSAMTTMSHRYLAYIFFNEEQVKYIMSQNIVIEVDSSTKEDEIEIGKEEEIKEEMSEEEKQILTRDEGNDLYKVIEVSGTGYKGHLLVVYDPSKIQLIQEDNLKRGYTIESFAKKYNAVSGINAGGFNYYKSTGYQPTGTVIIDGEVRNDGVPTGFSGGIIGFNNENVLVLLKNGTAQEALDKGIRDAVTFGPFLIVNGETSKFKGNGGYGIAPRTAIGQRKDGIVLMLVIDGRRPGHSLGVDMVELTNIMVKYGAYNAANLDGGGSSTFVANGKTLSVAGGSGYTGDRYLPNAWLLIP